MNVVVVQGALSSAPQSRPLPSGDRLGTFEVTVRSVDGPAESLPVVWFSPPDRVLRLEPGTEVMVVGRVRRRFFRTAAGTGSRTEVVADQLVPTTQRKKVEGLLRAAAQGICPAEVAETG